MRKAIPKELQSVLEDLQAQLAGISERIARLEKGAAPAVPAPNGAPKATAATVAPEPEAATPISEEELVAISAALAAVFGVRMHIRQVRLISSRAWAQEGRAFIQASHRLHT
jgi:methylmalonyl-CoA carboxyltransferase 12S subunit